MVPAGCWCEEGPLMLQRHGLQSLLEGVKVVKDSVGEAGEIKPRALARLLCVLN